MDNGAFERLNRYESALWRQTAQTGLLFGCGTTIISSVSKNLKHVVTGPLRRAGNVGARGSPENLI
jgi:hypothetical protein